MSHDTIVIKIGGNEIDDPQILARFVEIVKGMGEAWPVVVHGGGKEIARFQECLGLRPCFVEGLRVTDEGSLQVAEMVLSGLVNKRLVARLVAAGVPAVGLSGVDWGLIRVEKMTHPAGDLGWVGRIVEVHPEGLKTLISHGVMPVISPISLGLDGFTYNVNADHAALAIAVALRAAALVFVSDVPGVLIEDQLVPRLTVAEVETLIDEGKIYGGMVPKVRSALQAVAGGVQEVRITDVNGLQRGTGTTISLGG